MLLCNWTPLVRVRCPTEEQSGANTVFAVCASGAQRLPQVDIPALVQAFRLAPPGGSAVELEEWEDF